MFIKYILTSVLIISYSFSSNYDLEYTGVMVNTITENKEQKNYLVKRNIPKECKNLPINNEMLWTGNFAHEKVPEKCKSTYVHTKGKLLPINLYNGLETYGELEVLAFIKEMQHNNKMLLIDSRNPSWFDYRTIPAAINMPFVYFKNRDNYEFHFEYALKHLGIFIQKDGEYDFSDAKTLVLFCNGPWCTQSPNMLYALIAIGYPVEKLKWYRGGMQDWLGAGMTSTRN